jgi:predicted pyridoxine 5'-phosphate oxidase superfamily flavin-nucleotide-binding protein
MGLLTDDMKRVLSEQRLGFVATVCPDGTPNLSPKGTTQVWDDDHLVFCDLASPRTVENLRANPAVEVNVVDQVTRTGYRFKGSATVLEEGELFDAVVNGYETDGRRLPSDLPKRVRAVVLIRVERALPLVSPAYAWASEDEIRAEWLEYWGALEPRA